MSSQTHSQILAPRTRATSATESDSIWFINWYRTSPLHSSHPRCLSLHKSASAGAGGWVAAVVRVSLEQLGISYRVNHYNTYLMGVSTKSYYCSARSVAQFNQNLIVRQANRITSHCLTNMSQNVQFVQKTTQSTKGENWLYTIQWYGSSITGGRLYNSA